MADSSRSEKPTARRLEKARGEGQFIVSKDLITAGQFLMFVMLFGSAFPAWFTGMKAMLRESLAAAFRGDLEITRVPGIARALIDRAFLPLAGLAGASVLTAMAVHLSVTRGGFSLKKFQPDFGKFNPANKIPQIASQAPGALLQVAAMLVAFTATIYYIVRANIGMFLTLPFASLEVGLSKIGGSLKELLWKATAVFIVFGVIDLIRQKRKYTKQLRMTKQEVKEEAKEMEANPHVRGKLKRLRRDLARRRMMKAVPTATAVIVNPTHYAVALRYEHTSMATPVVVAKGKNYLALRIRQIAIENQVPLVENPPLAQALYKSVEIGREIPPDLYRAVAEVLAYIHKLTSARRQSRPRGPRK
jgi:flagellar biosynthetic protein FlhB